MSDEHEPNLVVLRGGDESLEERELTTTDISEAEKVEFLQLVRQGLNRQEAAAALGYRARPWRALTSTRSPFFDEEFANAYAETIGSPEAKLNMLERLREETLRRGLLDSDRLLEKLMLVHDPEWQVLRQKDVNVNIRAVIQQQFRELPTELLEQLLSYLDARSDETREIVDGDFMELTTAGGNGDGD